MANLNKLLLHYIPVQLAEQDAHSTLIFTGYIYNDGDFHYARHRRKPNTTEEALKQK